MGKIRINNPEANQAIIASGTINQHEEILYNFTGTLDFIGKSHLGWAFITDKRFVFGKRASGWGSKGIDTVFECSLDDILSVTTSGLWEKKVNLSIKQSGQPYKCEFFCLDNEICSDKVIESKKAFKAKETIEAKTIIIEEAKKDKASEILQKRLARGEISLDEFHQKIQRT